jgi:excisionase family DNA binding protein
MTINDNINIGGDMMDSNDDQVIFTVEEAAKYAKVHWQTIYRMVRSGQLPAAKLGREWRIHKEILDKYIKGELK